jgi:hypothetical protein
MVCAFVFRGLIRFYNGPPDKNLVGLKMMYENYKAKKSIFEN